MTKKTLREQFIAGLTALGEVKVENARSSKYVVFKRTKFLNPQYPGSDMLWYVGVSGALRTGKTVSGSIPCSLATKNKILQLALNKESA